MTDDDADDDDDDVEPMLVTDERCPTFRDHHLRILVWCPDVGLTRVCRLEVDSVHLAQTTIPCYQVIKTFKACEYDEAFAFFYQEVANLLN
jgi:hypothetical protein